MLERHCRERTTGLTRNADRFSVCHRAEGWIVIDFLGQEPCDRRQRGLRRSWPKIKSHSGCGNPVRDHQPPVILRANGATKCNRVARVTSIGCHRTRVGNQRFSHGARKARDHV